jgi:O-antigen/teichoic acid export membrane protein
MFEELKKISSQTLIYAVGILLSKAIGFFLIPLYTHYLTPEDYGILELLELTSFFAGFFIAMGIHNAILRYFAYYDQTRNKYEVISTAILFVSFSGFFITIILVIFSNFFSQLVFDTVKYSYLFSIVFVNLYFGILLELCRTSLRAEGKSVLFTILAVIYTFFAVSLNILFIVVLRLGIKGILYSTFIVQLILLFYLAIYFYPKTKLHFSFSKLKPILKYGIPFIPTGIFLFILNWADRYFLKIYANLEIIGLYSLGYKIGMIVVMLGGFPFSLFWNAYMFDVYKKPDAKKIYSNVMTYYFLVLSFIALGLSCLSKELITILADPAFLKSYLIVPLISFAMVFMTLDNILRVGILTSNKTHFLPYVEGFAAVVHIGLNFLLIPSFGMVGAGISTLLSYVIRANATIFVSNRFYPIQFEYKRLLLIIANVAILIFVSKIIRSETLGWAIAGKILIVLIFPVLLYLTNFFQLDEKNYIKYNIIKIPKAVVRFFYSN